MSGITYRPGDATDPAGDGPKVVAHVCNDAGGWGRGFVLAVSRRWPEPEAAYRSWHAGRAGRFGLGATQFVEVGPDLWVANMVAQAGFSRGPGRPAIRYPALASCLAHVAGWATANNASVHMPRIGCGLAGGRWDEVEPIVARSLAGISVTVYDLPQAPLAGAGCG